MSAEDAPVPATNALETIQGKVAGVSALPQGQAGSGTEILLRSPTSISKNNSPLIVVDGVIPDRRLRGVERGPAEHGHRERRGGEGCRRRLAVRLARGLGCDPDPHRRGSGAPDGVTRFTVRSEYGSNAISNRVNWAQSHYYLVNNAGQWVSATGAVIPREQRVPEPIYSRFQDNFYAPDAAFNQVERFFDPGNFAKNSINIAQNTAKTNWFFSYVNGREDGVVLNSGRYNQDDFRLNLDHRPRAT